MKLDTFQDVNERGTIRRIDCVGAKGSKKYAPVYLPSMFRKDAAPV